MSICWYCHWGWPAQVMEIYCRGVAAVGGDQDDMDFGQGHVVWSDENFDTHTIQACIDEPRWRSEYINDEQAKAVVQSLRELLLIPEEIRCCEPEDYDGEHPENYPPPAGVVMVRSGGRIRRAMSRICERRPEQ